MPTFDECCVLIPAATLEDFPSDLSDYDARSLLAAWTILWHPALLAENEQVPVWYRADGPPDPIGKRLVTLPAPSVSQLPEGWETRARKSEEACLVIGGSRGDMLESIGLSVLPPLCGRHRSVGVEDFYAAGFASLQIQVMTRRLRYTSNLDEIHLQNRIVAAAQDFLQGRADPAIAALHDVFDCLAEERDHYFSSDPHLVDLTLTSRSTFDSLIGMLAQISSSREDATEKDANEKDVTSSVDEPEEPAASDPAASDDSDECAHPLPTPSNVLIDHELVSLLNDSESDAEMQNVQLLREAIKRADVGWAGGGPPSDVCLDAMTYAQAEAVFVEAQRRTCEAIGAPPEIYGRFSGSTPSDMTRVLARLGYVGMIPLDFAGGTGHGEEAKVIVQAGGAELEALTAKPIDASSDAAFLTIGARLGESIDSGEIATGLMVHWPGQGCDGLDDLRRTASWCLALGKFWKLDQYFRDGERPYHHGTANLGSQSAASLLERQVEAQTKNPISSLAAEFRRQVSEECAELMTAMSRLTTGKVEVESQADERAAAEQFGAAVLGSVSFESSEDQRCDRLLINPHSTGCRQTVDLRGNTSPPADHVYASTASGGQAATTVDVPACGFVLLRGRGDSDGGGVGKSIYQKLLGRGPKPIAVETRLRNEFMEIGINPDSGGISGVYSGATRGNRFSMRLVRGDQRDRDAADKQTMHCKSLRIVESTPAVGSIETQGEIIDAGGKKVLAEFSLRYTLNRGSRVLCVEGEVSAADPFGDDPWRDYLACRVAVAGEAAIFRSLLRDKVHRFRSRRLVSPLGVVIDEAERQTLVASGGLPFHRRVGDRFLDTLVMCRGESSSSFTLHYGFDVPAPVDASRSLIVPPICLPASATPEASEIGWIVHPSPKEIVVTGLTVERRGDGKLAGLVRVTQTRSQPCKASIRFFHDVEFALLVDGQVDDPLNITPPAVESKDDATNDPEGDGPPRSEKGLLKVDGDQVMLSLPSHGVADVLVVFRSG